MPAVSRRRFDYSVPARWESAMRVGARVRVPLGGRRIGAWVTEVDVEPPQGIALRAITGYSGYGPPGSVLDLAEWGAWRWAMPVATLVRTASPERNVEALPAAPHNPSPVVSRSFGVTLVRRGPATDLLDVVQDAIGSSPDFPVLVLVPNVGWAGRLTDRLRRRGVAVADGWAQAAAGWPVIVGSRSAAWAPIPRLGAAVVLDAHDYRGRFDAAEVVVERCRRDGASCTLVSPCPTAEQVARFGPPVVADRAEERAGWPAVSIVDRRGADPRSGLFSDELVALAHRVAPGRLVCVLNRTGRARLLACAACGELARCETCGRPVEDLDGRLSCRGCGTIRPRLCATCGGTRLKVLRQGVSRVREELAALLGVPVGQVAGPRLPVPDDSVLVGTEAVLHRVRQAAAVAFLDFDQHLLAPRYVAGEESLGLLARAGRMVGGRTGTVLVQTRMPDHEVLSAAVAGDPSRFTEQALRRELRLPPATALAVVTSEHRPDLAGVEVSALADGRWLVRAADHAMLCDALEPLHGGVIVDPTDL